MAYTILFPPRVDVSAVSALHQEWLSKASSHLEIALDCHMVEAFSAAAAQLVVSLSLMLGGAGKTLKIEQVSAALRDDFTTLGLAEYLS